MPGNVHRLKTGCTDVSRFYFPTSSRRILFSFMTSVHTLTWKTLQRNDCTRRLCLLFLFFEIRKYYVLGIIVIYFPRASRIFYIKHEYKCEIKSKNQKSSFTMFKSVKLGGSHEIDSLKKCEPISLGSSSVREEVIRLVILLQMTCNTWNYFWKPSPSTKGT